MPRPICRHCGRRPVNRPRGLCRSCYYSPGVRELHPMSKFSPTKYAGEKEIHGERPLPAEPIPPGTSKADREAILSKRASALETLWHPDDAPPSLET